VRPVATLEQWTNDVVFLKRVLRREEQLRMCDAQQDLFAQVEGRFDMDWIDLADTLQRNVVAEFGDGGDPDLALRLLRTAAKRFPDDHEMAAISVYRRHNKARRGDLRVGDVMPDVMLAAPAPMSLDDYRRRHAPNRPMVIIAGSWT